MQEIDKKDQIQKFLRLSTPKNRLSRILQRVAIAFLVLAILYFFLGGEFGIINYFRFHQLEKKHINELALEKNRNDSLKAEITRLTSDTLYIESLARKHLGMIKPDEQIVIFKEKK